MICPENIKTRSDLVRAIAQAGLTGNWAEVGVQRGDFSSELLALKPRKLYMIDAWRQFPVKDYFDVANVPPWRQAECFLATFRAVYVHGDRAVMIRELSVSAAEIFPDRFFDFVFIDANHSYDAVKADLNAWYPKVKPGGVFAGHDFMDSAFNGDAEFGVKTAVTEFAHMAGVHERLGATAENWPTWYFVKPKPVFDGHST